MSETVKTENKTEHRWLLLLLVLRRSRRRRLPGEEEGDGQVVEDIDDDVVVGDGVDLRARELAVDQYPLHSHPRAAIGECRPNQTKVEEVKNRGRAGVEAYLLLDAERVDVAEGDVPGVEPVRVVGARLLQEQRGEEDDDEGRRRGPGGPLHSSSPHPHLARPLQASEWCGTALHCSYRCELSLLGRSWRAGGDGRSQTVSVRAGGKEGGNRGPGRFDLLRRGGGGREYYSINEGGAGFCPAVKVKLWIRGVV